MSNIKFVIEVMLTVVALAPTQVHTRSRINFLEQRNWPDTTIVGGEDALPGEIPWQVSFERTRPGEVMGDHFCGGSIYNNEWIISAAHCVVGENLDNPLYVGIVAGEFDRYIEDGFEQRIAVDKIIMHERFSLGTYLNDISLLHLAEPIVYNERVGPIELPTKEQQSSGDALISGWGYLRSDGVLLPNHLKKVNIPVVTDEVCQEQYKADGLVIYPSMICAGIPGTGGVDSCQGDSGGPMVCYNPDGSEYLCGIVSWGIDTGCALPDYSGVYTEVSYFVDWIKNNTITA